jgi:putative molybdopterin biosynthesis protein
VRYHVPNGGYVAHPASLTIHAIRLTDVQSMQQSQFLEVIDRDEAERRFQAALQPRPLEAERVSLAAAWQRVLAEDIVAPLDVPSFDRANVDGFALRAEDTFAATEQTPRTLRLNAEVLSTGREPRQSIRAGTATAIATGAVVPRGADAVVMVEYTDAAGDVLTVRRPVAPGANITFAGTDIGRGETVLRHGELLTARETGVLAALGVAEVPVIRRPRVAIVSTGDEILPPGAAMRLGHVYDSNATILADAVRELGGEPVSFGIVPDDEAALRSALREAVTCDVVLLSGGTSKGPGDLSYRVLGDLGPPGIVAHGVALKPGKPLCLAVVHPPDRERAVAVAVLPGFPTSAIFTFREFVAPVIRQLGGRRDDPATVLQARLPVRVNSERGRTEYLLVGLVQKTTDGKPEHQPPTSEAAASAATGEWAAYPMGKGSGSVTTFSRADGFVVIPRQREYIEAGDAVEVHLLGQGWRPADLVVIGSHCVGLDFLLGHLQDQGFTSKFLAVGSMGGLTAAQRGECDVAGIHLLDPNTGVYNRPFLTEGLKLLPGYGRLQGIVFRHGDVRFEGKSASAAVSAALGDPTCVLVNRNRGSGTRILIDQLLGKAQPPGYLAEARSHNAVVAAVAQGRADWGVAIATVAADAGLGFLPLQEEQYDFVIPESRWDRPAVQALRTLLTTESIRNSLSDKGFRTG